MSATTFPSSLTVTPDGAYTVIGYNGGLITVFSNTSGKLIPGFSGGSGTVQSLAASTDGRFLLSGASDQTVRLWEMRTGKNLLSIFHSNDNEWVAWTPEGFFDASENGSKYIGYHINRGKNNAADYISVAQVYDLFYRPDLVQKKIAGESLQQYADRIDIKHVIKSGLPPRVAILSPDRNKKSKARDVTLRYRLCDQGGGIGKAQIRINGITIGASQNGRALKRKNAAGKVSSCREYDRLLSLQPGNNRISLSAYNRNGDIESPATSVTLAYKGKQKRPDLHVLAIAVDRYRDGDLRLKYSRKDADAIVSALGNGGKKLFGQVHRYTLYDDEVRKQQISNIFDKVSKNARPEDVFVLYVAGHGVTSKDDGNYYYLPVNFRYTSDAAITKQAISNDFFQQNLAKVPAQKSLVLLDTCNSGAFSNIRTRGIEEKTAISRLVKSTGRATIMASSRDQVALEGHKDHGVFTWSLLEGMKGNAYGGDNKLTINELADYVEETLPELTYSKYGYEQVPQRVLQGMNFPLALR
ncbi:MAG TPA: hypothetical protein ENJ64_05165 [Thiotrichales bacterium]|nr:hypothetical protein [Thiotrichales bacterium]